jgi:hypothetical protein
MPFFSVFHRSSRACLGKLSLQNWREKGVVALTLKDKRSRDMLVESARQRLNAAARCSITHSSSTTGRPGVRPLVSIFRVHTIGVVCDCGDAVLESEARALRNYRFSWTFPTVCPEPVLAKIRFFSIK